MGACCGASKFALVAVVAGAGGLIAGRTVLSTERVETISATAFAAGQPEGGAEFNEEMAAWMEAGTPNEHHRLLERFVGTWSAEAEFTMDPDAPPVHSTGSQSNEAILDGRFVAMHYDADFMGMPFEGMGVMGYDNIKKAYVSAWIDSMSTMIYTESGDYDPSKKTFTMHSRFTDPTGKKVRGRQVITLHSPDKYSLDMYHSNDGGEWQKQGSIMYTRQ